MGLLGLMGVLALLTIPAVIFGTSDNVRHQYYYDAVIAHLPQINYFIAHPFDLKSYPATAAMTPGHHLFLAWAAALFGYDKVDPQNWVLVSLNYAAGFGFVAMVWLILRRLGATPWVSAALALPLAGSSYVVSSIIWISTDDAGLFFFALTLFVALFYRERPLFAGLSGTLLVFWRHLYLPALGVFAAAPLFEGRWPTRRELISSTMALLPPVLIVLYFWSIWGGLTPPLLQNTNKNEFSPGVPLQAFALLSLLSAPFALTLLRGYLASDKRKLVLIAGGFALVVLGLWLMGPTDYNRDAGRWGSVVWVFAKLGPSVQGHSPVVLLLALGGAAVLSVLFAHALTHRLFPAATVMLVLYIVAYSAQIMAWQRYLEPQILLTLAVFAVQSGPLRKWELAGPLAMAAIFCVLTTARIYGALDQLFG